MGGHLKNSGSDRHMVRCPHCGRDVLDHMTACPFCGGELTPAGYRPPDPVMMRKLRLWFSIAGFAVAAALVVWILLTR